MGNYSENLYKYFQKKGYSPIFEHAGVYKISIDKIVVYVGKSDNMLKRLAQHYAAIKYPTNHKYYILAEAKRKRHVVRFEVLYYAKSKTKRAIIKEIGEVEGQYIRALRPPLNYQIPKEENWRLYDINPSAKTISLYKILKQ